MTEEFKAAGDDYSHIMAEALADRLAEVRACSTVACWVQALQGWYLHLPCVHIAFI